MDFSAWIKAFRLRTLPLALSSILLGSFLAAKQDLFSWPIFGLAILTTIFLQILSNLANDYGDFQNGADNADRIGPDRMVQSGRISKRSMLRSLYVFALLSFLSGLSLILIALSGKDLFYIVLFVGLGILSIIAAVKYTAGENPYGYRGLGDLFVFLFFGLTGVLGSYYLFTQSLDASLLLPAASIGMLSTGVLNLNNMRDSKNDQEVGKITVAVKLGKRGAKIYHCFLLIGALVCALLFSLIHFESNWQLLFFVVSPILAFHLVTVWKIREAKHFDPLLKQLAFSSLLFVLTFGIGLLIA
ncbi:UNVERIFIED_CONTAM: hypothetical protein GTU68_030886 [Idotea baltica]|nr:hypothetical protein [Idotea baltica]